jgi:hypothetical protein
VAKLHHHAAAAAAAAAAPAAVEDRIAAWTLMPVSHQEDLQVLRYQDGQKYEPHHDFFDDEVCQPTTPP